MPVTWKLDGGTVASPTSLADLGLYNLIRTRRSLALDGITFRALGANVDSTALFAYGDEVTLTRDDGVSPVVWFAGRCMAPSREASGDGEWIVYTISGTWWYFENLVFQQIWPLDAGVNSHLTSPTTYRRALVIAGLASSTGLRQNTKAFIEDVLDWLIASGTGAVMQYTAGDLPTGFEVPFTRLDAPTCDEAMQAITRWMPDACSWFDYSTSPPTFHLNRRSGAGSAIDYALGDLSHIAIVPRNELQLEKLIIQFVTLNASGLVVLNEDKDPSGSGTTGREWGSAVFTIDNNYIPIAAGLAANYRSGLSTLQYSGSIVIEEVECSQAVHPGNLINVTDGLAEWETMAAQVTQVVEDFDHGRTTITVGPQKHIRLDDLVEVLRIARNQSDQSGGSGEILKTGKAAAKNQQLTEDFAPAAGVPTFLEIADAIEDAYVGKPAPKPGDVVDVTIDSTLRYTAFPHTVSAGATGDFIVGFIVNSVQYYAHVYNTAAWRTITQALTVAGVVPTAAEISTGLQTAFSGTARPHHGDAVVLTVGGTPKFRYVVDFKQTSASGLKIVAIVLSGRTCYAVMHQLGIY